MLKGLIQPSSPELTWETVAALLSVNCTQAEWKPTPAKWKPKGTAYDFSIDWMGEYFCYVDSSLNEMGKMPVLCDMLIQGLASYKKMYRSSHTFRILPVARVLKEYRTNYLVGVAECSAGGPRKIRSLILYELKPSVAYHVTSVEAPNLAQAIVEGYYALLGAPQDLQAIVIGLTDIGVTHYFKLKLPTTRNNTTPRHMELLWYQRIQLNNYPPTSVNDIKEFMEFFHKCITEVL